jgi:hypothetical protein
MKKVMIAVFALCVASPVMAAVGIELGTNWYKVNYTDNVGDHLMGQGQNMLVYWGLDNDLSVGAYTENDVMSTNYGSSYSFELMAIQIAKGIVKNVNFGLNLGTAYFDWISGPLVVTDVFASVVILSGASDKVSGTVKAVVAGRFAREVYNGSDYDFSGLNVGLAIGLGF